MRPVLFPWLPLGILWLLALGASPAIAQSTTGDNKEIVTTLSRALLEEQLKTITTGIKDLQTEKRTLEQVRTRVKTRPPRKQDDTDAKLLLDDLRAKVKALKEDKGEWVEFDEEPASSAFASWSALANWLRPFPDPFEHWSPEPSPSAGLDGDESIAYSKILSGLTSPRAPFLGDDKLLPKTIAFLNKLRNNRKLKRAGILVQLNEVNTEVDNLQLATLNTVKEDYRGKVEKYESDIGKAIDKRIEDITGELADKQKQLTSVDKTLRERETSQNSQAAINEKLVWAVFGMIGSIVLLFLILRWFPEKISLSIIGERTMIELLSMGFLLLTVIILATGGKLETAAVGTLLGTIAGYIFGRKESDSRRDARKEGPSSGEEEDRASASMRADTGRRAGRETVPPQPGNGNGHVVGPAPTAPIVVTGAPTPAEPTPETPANHP